MVTFLHNFERPLLMGWAIMNARFGTIVVDWQSHPAWSVLQPQQLTPTLAEETPEVTTNNLGSLLYYLNALGQRFSTWGTRTPNGMWGGHRGYVKSPQGYAKLKNPTQMKLIWVEYFIWGYAKEIQVWFGGMQRGKILIREYASTKRLRTPALDSLAI